MINCVFLFPTSVLSFLFLLLLSLVSFNYKIVLNLSKTCNQQFNNPCNPFLSCQTVTITFMCSSCLSLLFLRVSFLVNPPFVILPLIGTKKSLLSHFKIKESKQFLNRPFPVEHDLLLISTEFVLKS